MNTFVQEVSNRAEETTVLCSLDDKYCELEKSLQHITQGERFIAGKTEMKGFTNLFVGQNTYDVLSGLVERHFAGSES